MAAALECWSSRTSIDEDMVEQVLMKTQERSEAFPGAAITIITTDTNTASSITKESMQQKWQRISRNVAGKITNLKNSLNLDSVVRDPSKVDSRKHVWGGVVRNLTQLYPGSQLPEKLICNIRRHFDSLPLSYAQAGFDMKEVFLHIRLIEQAGVEDQPAVSIQEISSEIETHGAFVKLTFACNSSISWPAMSGALDSATICCKKIQLFEKKNLTIGILLLLIQSGHEKLFKTRIETALRAASKKPKVKLSFGLCGCQEENTKNQEGESKEPICDDFSADNSALHVEIPLVGSSFLVSVDERQILRSGAEELGKWLLNSDQIEFTEQICSNFFKGVYRGKRVVIEKLRGCERGNAYEIEFRRDLLELMSCGHKNILQFYGVCMDEVHGMCSITKMMEGGSVQEIIQRNRKLQSKEILKIAIDVAEGIMFMNDHGVVYKDLNSHRILLDRQGNACLGDMGVISPLRNIGEITEYETAGYRWLAPEIIAGDPESVSETWMSNVYSFGMVIWEMVSGEVAYSSYSPVQAAVGIAACGLRPDIPLNCPPVLTSLMQRCWNSCPAKRPQFSDIISTLMSANTR